MAATNYAEMARAILDKAGGRENIASHTHCATRLRIDPVDRGKVDLKAIQHIPGVLGIHDNGSQVQVIVGQSVEQLYPEFEKVAGKGSGAVAPAAAGKRSLGRAAGDFLLMMASIMVPVIPALTTAGFIMVILTVLQMAGLVTPDSSTYLILNGFAQSAFYFLPIYVAYTAAKKFETEPIMAMMLAAGLLYPDFVNYVGELTAAGSTYGSYFGLPIYLMTYNGGVIQIVLSVWVMAKLDHWLSRAIPEQVRYFAKPLVLLVVMSVVVLTVTGPIGGYATNYVAAAIAWLTANVPWLVVPALVLFSCTVGQLCAGFHLALVPIATASIESVGYDMSITLWFFSFTVASGFVALAITLKSRNNRCHQLSVPAALSGLIGGISEPTVYGLCYRMVKPYYALTVTAVLAALLCGITGLRSYGYGCHSIPGLLLFLGPEMDWTNFYKAIAIVAFIAVCSFVTVFAFGFDDSVYDDEADEGAQAPDSDLLPGAGVAVSMPGKGSYLAQGDIPDPTFSQGLVGPCFAMKPATDSVKCPVDGTVSFVADTAHAVAIRTSAGSCVMVHVGIDSVSLGGKGLNALVSEGQRVKAGDPLVKFDKLAFTKAGIDDTVVVVLTEAAEQRSGDDEPDAGIPMTPALG
ncbi:glucose PTS transporter subunit IIA [Caniella muris]|uniref:glucose PTS transporter subunit IIA n=1 Tax=Caniella muris TaxID=2941502 RepID=UPI002040A192|nr:glucose PTS transporter subunit IIA [Caniella muris]